MSLSTDIWKQKRLKERTDFDLEMMAELGYCSGIENYSRYFDRRKPGTRPFCLIDYFPDDFVLIVDERSCGQFRRSEQCGEEIEAEKLILLTMDSDCQQRLITDH